MMNLVAKEILIKCCRLIELKKMDDDDKNTSFSLSQMERKILMSSKLMIKKQIAEIHWAFAFFCL